MNKIIIGFESFDSIRDNSRAFFEYLYKYHSDQFEFVYILFRNPYCRGKNKIEIDNLKVIYSDDENFELEFNKIDVIISSFTNGITYKKPYQIWINVWHGVGSKKIVFLDDASATLPLNFFEKIDYSITTSELMKVIYASSLNLPSNKVMLLGQPRNDYMFTSNSSELVLNKFNIDLSKYRKTILYMPTFRKTFFRDDGDFNEKNFLNLFEYDEEELINYLKQNNYLLLIKLHPSEDYEIPYSNNDYIKVFDKEIFNKERIEPTEIYSSIDLLVTDYSSAHSDYLLLDKPVLFIHADSDEFKNKRGILFNDFDLWYPGPKVKTIKEFILETNKLFADSLYYKNERERHNIVINNISQLNPAENCKRLADFIFNKILDENKVERNKLSKQIYELTNELDHKNNEINSINQQLNSKELELYNKKIELENIQIELKNKIIELSNKQVELYNKNIDLEHKEVELNNKSNELNNQTIELNNQTIELRNITIELENKTTELENKTTELENKTIELIKKTIELNNLSSSRSFKLSKKISSIYRVIRVKK